MDGTPKAQIQVNGQFLREMDELSRQHSILPR